MKKQSVRRNPNEMEINNLPDKELKETVIRVLIKLGVEQRNLQRTSMKRKYNEEPSRAEECNN